MRWLWLSVGLLFACGDTEKDIEGNPGECNDGAITIKMALMIAMIPTVLVHPYVRGRS